MKRKIAALLVLVLVATSIPWPVDGAGGISALAAETQSVVEPETENRAEDNESEKEEDINAEVTRENNEDNIKQETDIISEAEFEPEKREEDVELSEEKNVEENQKNNIENEEVAETLKENELDEEKDTPLATDSEVKNLDEGVETDEVPEPAVTTLADDELTYQIEGTDAVLYYTVTENEVTITGCDLGEITFVTIPDTIDGTYVTKIGAWSFHECSNLSEIILPDSITIIEEGAFGHCSNLESIGWPASLKEIGDFAFEMCTKLNEIEDLKNITSIGKGAFQLCENLERVGDMSSLTYLGDFAFNSCKNLKYVGNFSSLTFIGNGAFTVCENLKEINLTTALTQIGTWAFEDCGSLIGIGDVSSVTSIGMAAFRNCTMLESVGDMTSLNNLGGCAFEGCTSLTRVGDLGSANIEYQAFSGCTQLKEIGDMDRVTHIGSYAFNYCINLGKIGDMNSVTEIEYLAFCGCQNLQSIGNMRSLTEIGNNVFSGCINLKSIGDVSSLKSIQKGTFDVGFGMQLESIGNLESVEIIEEGAFQGYNTLVKIGEFRALKTIGDYAFAECEKLEEIKIYESSPVTEIGVGAFQKCAQIKRIGSLGKILTIKESTFSGCSSLEEIEIPETVTSIENNAFKGCGNLKKIALSDAIDNLGEGAFNGCSSLEEIELAGTITSIANELFENCKSIKRITLPEGIIDIGNRAFQGCENLEEIYLPNSVTSLGDNVFTSCRNLKEIELPNTITSMGNEIFQYCSNLNKIKLPNGVLSLGNGVFSGCTNLEEVELPINLREIGDETFKSCSKLNNIELPDTIISIGDNVFYDCENITELHLSSALTHFGNGNFPESFASETLVVYYEGSKKQWEDIYGEQIESTQDEYNVIVHCLGNDEEGDEEEENKTVRFFTNWDSDNKIANFFPSWETGATEKTDMSFLDNLDSLLNNYVLVTTESDPEMMFQDNLISLQPVETKRGIITEIAGEHIVIDGTIYQFAECYDLSNLAFLSEGGDVVYHLLDGRICEVDSLTWTKTGWLEGSTEGDVLKYHRDLSTEIYRVSPLAATQIRKKLAQYEKDNTIKILADSLNMAYDVVIGETDANFENCITKFVSYNQDTKEVTTYDNKTYTLPENLYTEDLMNQWVEIFVSIETGNVIESIERFEPNILVNIELLNQGPIYVNNGKYSYDGKDYYDKNNFSIPLRFTVENQEYSSTMITPEMMVMMQNDGVDFDVSLNKVTFNLPNNFGWIEDKEIKLEFNVILKPGEKWTAEGAIRPEFFDSLNDDAEREELIQVTVKWNDSEEEGRVISFTLKNMEKVEKALDEIEKGSKEIAEKAEKVNILKLQTSGLVTEKQLEEINASVAVWLSTITNPDCPTTIKKGMFDSYEYDAGNRTIKSTFKIPVEVVDGNTIKKVNFVFRAVIQDFDFSGIWEQIGLKLDSLGTFSTLEWKIEELSQYNNYQLCSVEASANIGNLNSAISEYAKSAVKEIKEVLTSTDSLPFNEAIENLPDPESYLTSLIRTMLINIAKGDNAITPKEICEWMEESYGKIIKIKCPVDVYVYHDGVECARIVNNQLNEELAQTNLGSIASVSGDEKTLILLGGGYEIELVGNDTGTMDYIVEEYSNFGSGIEPRIIKFDNLPLTKGMKYTGHIDDQILQPREEYALEHGGKSIIPDYDTLEGDEIKDLPSGNIPIDDNSPNSGNSGSTGSGNNHNSGGSSSGNSGSPSGNSSSAGTTGVETEVASVSTTKDQSNIVIEASAVCSCEEKCDAESINSDCIICSLDYTECMAEETDQESERNEPNDTEAEQNNTESKNAEAESNDAANAESQTKEEADTNIFGLVLVLFVVLLGGGAAIYYFKEVKSKQKQGRDY